MGKINDGEWDDAIEEQLGNAIAEAIDDFGPDFDEEGQPLEEGESDRVRERPEDEEKEDGEDEGESEDGEESEETETEEREEVPA